MKASLIDNSANQEQALTDFLHARGMRSTPERMAILRVVCSASRPMSVRQVVDALDAVGYHVTSATVYAAVKVMCEASLLHRVASANNALRFIASEAEPPALLVCSSCGKTRVVRLPQMLQQLKSRTWWGFSAERVLVRIEGLCSACRRRLGSSRKITRAKQ